MARPVALALLLSAAGMVSATLAIQPQENPGTSGPAIRLRTGTFAPARGTAPPPDALAPGQTQEAREYLLQFQGPVQDSWKASATAAGATLLEYIPDFAFRARLRPADIAAVRQLPFVAWLGPLAAADKLSPRLAGVAERPVLVRLDRDASADAVLAAMNGAGLRATQVGRALLMLPARRAQAEAIAALAGVASVEPFDLRVKHNEFGGGAILGSLAANNAGYDGSTQIVAVADTGLGTGVAGGVHRDLAPSRVHALINRPGAPDFCFETIVDDGAADVDSGHGTHVATAVLGAGDAAGVGRGTAPAARLVFQALENYAVPSLVCSLFYGVTDGYYLVGIPQDMGDLYQQAYDEGARLHSNSWGSAVDGAYTADSESTDAFVWAHRDMTLLFSAGNEGTDGDGNGRVDPGSVGSPATAKNVIAVGASENDRRGHWACDPGLSYTACAAQGGQNALFTYGATWPDRFAVNPLRDDPSAGNAEQIAAFSSRGPASDGRIKPDVVAPGTWTLSGYSDLYQAQYDGAPNPQTGQFQYDGWGIPADAAYKYMGGTSMAAPLAAGGAAVVRDFYQKVRGHQASAALVKATLVNSAVDLLDENNDGALDNAFPIPNPHEGWGRVDLANATDNGQQFSDESAPITTGATATFTFPVTEAGRPFKVTLAWTDYPASTSAATALVNDLDLTVVAPDGTTFLGNWFTGGWSTTGGSPDRVNNLENVFVASAGAGAWTVIVSGYNVPMGPQRFALLVDDGPVSDGRPIVRLSVEDGTAAEAGLAPGAVRMTRTGDTSAPLTVTYTVGGTATLGADFTGPTGSIVIPAGAADVTVPITPIDDALVEPSETVVVTLADDGGYTVGSPASGTVAIASDDLPPDLVVTSVAPPSTAEAGGTMIVTDTTRNQGTTSAPASETGFYLSANATVDAADAFLGSRVVIPLPPGATQSSSTSMVVPETTTPGVYYVIARADWSNQVPETSEANNARASSTVRIGPDLIVATISVPATGAPGGTIVVGDTTRNQGGGQAAAAVTGFYLSTNASWDATDLRLGGRAPGALAAGASSSGSTVVTIPAATASGTYYIVAKADADDLVVESAENNNTRGGSVRLGADLTVSTVTVPAVAAAGDTITVSDTSRNTGGAGAPASATDFHLSVNTSIDGSDVWLGSRAVSALEAGGSSTASGSLVIPLATPAGSYYVVARADANGEVAETSESNNLRASSVIKVGPDLTVSNVTAPSTGAAGEPLLISETVRNQGGAVAGATESVFYVSVNTSLDSSDVEIGRRAVPSLAGGTSDAGSRSLVLPASLATGTYYVLSAVDAAQLVAESTENNNVRASGAVRVGPDLTVLNVTAPTSAIRGSTIQVSDTTSNRGGGAAAASTTRIYLSANATFDAADTPVGSRGVPVLAAGAPSTAATTLTIPAGTAAGSYYLIARTDDAGVVTETAENNNTRATLIRIDP